MAYKSTPTIGEGSQLLYEDPLTPGTYLELDENTGNGAVGTPGEFVDATPLRAAAPRQVAGAQQVQTGEYVFFDVPDNANLAGFLVLSKAKATVKMRQVRTSGRQIDFTVTLNNRIFMEQTREGVDQVKVPYTQIDVEVESEV